MEDVEKSKNDFFKVLSRSHLPNLNLENGYTCNDWIMVFGRKVLSGEIKINTNRHCKSKRSLAPLYNLQYPKYRIRCIVKYDMSSLAVQRALI